MRLPLLSWQLSAASLPQADFPSSGGLSLPGLESLYTFEDLLGDAPLETPPSLPETQGTSFTLPGSIPEDIEGSVTLSRVLDFGRLEGDRAILTLDHLAGALDILLDDIPIAHLDASRPLAPALVHAFSHTAEPCMFAVDLTEALLRSRRQTLALRFSDHRPAGLMGPVFLTTTTHAHLSHTSVCAELDAHFMVLRTRINAKSAGHYTLRMQMVVPQSTSASIQEITRPFTSGESSILHLGIDVSAIQENGHFPISPVFKIQLFFHDARGHLVFCDDALLAGHYSPRLSSFLPLPASSAIKQPDVLARQLAELHIPAVSLDAPVPPCVHRAFWCAGIPVMQFCPSTSRNATLLRSALLRYPNVFPSASPLPSFEASSVRQCAEGTRQGMYSGSLCPANMWNSPKVRDILRVAFAPLHLSAFTRLETWKAGETFTAFIRAFIPQSAPSALNGWIVLEDQAGHQLAQLRIPHIQDGYTGTFETLLPTFSCDLTLRCVLYAGQETVEDHAFPVYVRMT